MSGNYAAKTCADLIANTFSDWKLPSKEELNLMYQNRILLITTSGIYWSTKEEELKLVKYSAKLFKLVNSINRTVVNVNTIQKGFTQFWVTLWVPPEISNQISCAVHVSKV